MKKVFIEFHNGEKIEEEIRNFSLYSAHKKVTFAWWNLKDRRKTYLKNDLKSIAVSLNNGQQIININ